MTQHSPISTRPKSWWSRLLKKKDAESGIRDSIAQLVHEEDRSLSPQADGEDDAELDRHERALIRNVLNQRSRTADDVMVPRPDIAALPDDISLEEALEIMGKEHHSRMPVYHKELDHLVGMIHVKDLVACVGREASFSIRSLLRQPLLIAPTIPVLDLLLQMRQRRTHMALVIDEYGSIDGLVTLEDLIETIVGDISDEHDEMPLPDWVEKKDGQIDLDARLPVEELERRLGPVLTDEEREADIETVGGLVFRLAEHIPTRNEVITHPSGLKFQVLDADPRHILTLRMKLPPKENPSGESGENDSREDKT